MNKEELQAVREGLKRIVGDFVYEVHLHNEMRKKRNKGVTDFEDDLELTFENFIIWINDWNPNEIPSKENPNE